MLGLLCSTGKHSVSLSPASTSIMNIVPHADSTVIIWCHHMLVPLCLLALLACFACLFCLLVLLACFACFACLFCLLALLACFTCLLCLLCLLACLLACFACLLCLLALFVSFFLSSTRLAPLLEQCRDQNTHEQSRNSPGMCLLNLVF